MNFSKIFRFTGSFLSVLIATATIHAGVIYEMTYTDYTDGVAGEPQFSNIAIEGNNLKVSLPENGSEKPGEMIYRGDLGEMVMIDHQRQQYFILDRATIEKISAQMKQAMAMFENMPPAQREMMEKMMKGRMPQMATTEKKKVEVRKTGERKKVNGYSTVKYEVTEDDIKAREHWVADWSDIEGSEEAFKAFKGMSSFFSEIMDTLSSGPMGGMIQDKFDSNWIGQLQNLDGFPAVTRTFSSDGKLKNESALQSGKKTDLNDSDFQAPEDYKQQTMNMR